MSRPLRHIRSIKRGTPHVHGCLLCQRWKNDPLCTDAACDIVGETFDEQLVGGRKRLCVACRAEYDHEQALRALRAFGAAVATIARAHLVSTACRGSQINGKRGQSVAVYSARDELWLVYRASSLEPQEIESPHPADRAAEVVALMIEEATR